VDRAAHCADLVAFSIWYHHASEKATPRARRIANVLADLSESLYGIRVVTAPIVNVQYSKPPSRRGAYRDANAFTGRVNAVYGPSTLMIGILGQAMLLASAVTWSFTTSSAFLS